MHVKIPVGIPTEPFRHSFPPSTSSVSPSFYVSVYRRHPAADRAGLAVPRVSTLEKIAAACGVTVADLQG